MPIACDPNSTFILVLKSDESKPAASRPGFIFRYLTGRQWKGIDEIQRESGKTETNTEGYDRLIDGIKTALVDWRNMTDRDGRAIEFDPSKLDDILTLAEAWELLFGILANTSLQKEEKKNLDSPSDSSTEPSAAIAKD